MYSSRKLVLFAVLLALALSSAVSASGTASDGKAKITLEEARKIALKKVEGTVEDEFSIEDDEGNVTDYIFYIKDKKGKTWEVQIGAEKGEIVSAEMQEEVDSEDPPADEDPPALR
ncbi:MAG: PepSY domain-containing protein [Acidobacteriota bacterium]|nr:MAG: PepSY domain-containing protein [Acidobacteriota bacterium]